MVLCYTKGTDMLDCRRHEIRVLTKKAKYFKEDKKRVNQMCEAMEELIMDEKEEMIIEIIKLEKLSFEEIASASKVSLEFVKNIA